MTELSDKMMRTPDAQQEKMRLDLENSQLKREAEKPLEEMENLRSKKNCLEQEVQNSQHLKIGMKTLEARSIKIQDDLEVH